VTGTIAAQVIMTGWSVTIVLIVGSSHVNICRTLFCTTYQDSRKRPSSNENHLLCYPLSSPSAASWNYNVRRRPHSQLGRLIDANFINRTLK